MLLKEAGKQACRWKRKKQIHPSIPLSIRLSTCFSAFIDVPSPEPTFWRRWAYVFEETKRTPGRNWRSWWRLNSCRRILGPLPWSKVLFRTICGRGCYLVSWDDESTKLNPSITSVVICMKMKLIYSMQAASNIPVIFGGSDCSCYCSYWTSGSNNSNCVLYPFFLSIVRCITTMQNCTAVAARWKNIGTYA